MNEKKPSAAELEQKLANSKVTKTRVDILNNIRNDIRSEISKAFESEYSKESSVIGAFKMPHQKNDVEEIIKAIESAIGDAYIITEKTVCKIADHNDLTFHLKANTAKHPVVAAAKKRRDSLTVVKSANEAKLSKWYRRQLFNIANGLDFEQFEVDKPKTV